jgi:hypothetical protein
MVAATRNESPPIFVFFILFIWSTTKSKRTTQQNSNIKKIKNKTTHDESFMYMIPRELRITWAFKDGIIPKNPRYHLTSSKAGSRPCLLNVINSSNDCAEGSQVIIGYSFHYVTKIILKNNPQSSPIHLSKILSLFFSLFFLSLKVLCEIISSEFSFSYFMLHAEK